jgi:hypothetical protein
VEKICQDVAAGVQVQNCRYVKRLTPITAIEKANAKGLEAVAKQVLAPHFHGKEQIARKVRMSLSLLHTTVGDTERIPSVLAGKCANALGYNSSQSSLLSATTKS